MEASAYSAYFMKSPATVQCSWVLPRASRGYAKPHFQILAKDTLHLLRLSLVRGGSTNPIAVALQFVTENCVSCSGGANNLQSGHTTVTTIFTTSGPFEDAPD